MSMRMAVLAMVMACAVATPVALAKGGHGGRHGGHGGGKGKTPGVDDGGGTGPGDSHGNGGKHGGACDAASVDALETAVGAACPCDGLSDGAGGVVAWKNHGQYVRCVAHALRDAARSGGTKRKCVRGVVPCAARSACGKNGAITCLVATADTCVGGTCTSDASRACVVDADCTTTACGVTSAADCASAGGVAGSTPSCCTASPSGAFVE